MEHCEDENCKNGRCMESRLGKLKDTIATLTQERDEARATVETQNEALDLWDRINKAAGKFSLQHLHQTGDEWVDFCEAMKRLRLRTKAEDSP
jgi:hypothetical protein